jgi:hypothetical protein
MVICWQWKTHFREAVMIWEPFSPVITGKLINSWDILYSGDYQGNKISDRQNASATTLYTK